MTLNMFKKIFKWFYDMDIIEIRRTSLLENYFENEIM